MGWEVAIDTIWSKLLDVGLFAITPGTVVVVGWAVWRDLKRDILEGKEARKRLERQVNELHETINNNGFVKEKDLAKVERRIDRLEYYAQ